MRALHAIESLGRGGAEQLLATLLPEIARRGVSVGVAVRGGAMELAPVLLAAGVPVHVMPRRHRWNLLASAMDIARLARAEGFSVIHAHLYFPAVTVALSRILRLHSARTCVTFHNLAYAGANREGVGLRFRRWLARRLYPKGFDVLFAVSEAVSRHYAQALGLEDVKVLHNPIDIDSLDGLIARERDVGAKQHIVVPGRVVKEKGHLDFLAALKLMGAGADQLRVTFAGDGPMRSVVEAEARRLSLDGLVSFSGALPHGRLMELVAGADLVVVPSRYEGFGLTALEAMGLGRAVVATNVGGLPEVVGEAGVLVPPGDPHSLAAAMQALLDDDPRRVALGQAARTRARAEFSLPVIARRLIEIYRAIDNPKHRTSNNS